MGKTLLNECPAYDTKQSDVEVPVILEIWEMRRTSSLPSLPCPLWHLMGQIEINCVLMLNWIVRNRTIFDIETMCKQKNCDTMWVVHHADDPFVCFGAKPNKGLSSRSSTRAEVDKGTREKLEKGTQRRSWRRVTQKGSRQRSAEGSSEGRPVRMSRHSK